MKQTRNPLRVPQAHLGFFSKPITISKSHVLKKYNLKEDKDAIKKIYKNHESFLEDFRNIGIKIPKTTGEIISLGKNKYTLYITQSRFSKERLAGEIVKNGSRENALMVLEKIIIDASKYLNSSLSKTRGFHPTLRNYAFSEEDEAYLIDTFPPYTTQEETKKMMIAASPNIITKLGLKYSDHLANYFTKEYYDGTEMISGIIKTAIRMKPNLRNDLEELTLNIVDKNIPSLKKQIKKTLENPKQSLLWKIAHKIY